MKVRLSPGQRTLLKALRDGWTVEKGAKETRFYYLNRNGERCDPISIKTINSLKAKGLIDLNEYYGMFPHVTVTERRPI